MPSLAADLIGASAWLGIRPHHLVIDPDKGPIKATVKVVEPTGVETFVFCEFEGRDIACQVTRHAAPPKRADIRLSPNPAGILLFDRASGKRIH